MKKIISLTMTLFVLVNLAKAQTNWQDYRYVTAGLKDDLSKGKEPKTGYSIEAIGREASLTQSGNMRTVRLYYFKKGTVTRGFAVYCWDAKNQFYFYLCIPTANAPSEIWNKYLQDIGKVDVEWHTLFSWAFAQIISQKM